MNPLLLLLVSLLFCSIRAQGCASATYKLTIDFPDTVLPDGPASLHLSPLTAFSHNRRFSAFVLYGYATDGVQIVAETGATGVFLKELEHPLVKDIASVKNIIFRGEKFEVEVEVDCNSPFISLISMVAPSPDWIVAISGMDMRDPESGEFVAMREGGLKVYDAGTDSGETLTAGDVVTDPKENISPLVGAPFFGEEAAQYKLELIKEGMMESEDMPCRKGAKGKRCRQRKRKQAKKSS